MNHSFQSGVRIGGEGTFLLLEALARELLTLPTQDYASTWIVMPTQRLATSLLAMLSAQKGTLRPPRIWTLDGFLHEAASPALFPLQPADPWLVELTLQRLLQEGEYLHLRAGDHHELLQLFADIQEEEKEGEIFHQWESHLLEDVYKSDGHIQVLQTRLREIQSVYHKLEAQLQKQGLMFSDLYARAQVEVLISESFIPPWERLYIFGFTTIKRYYGKWLSQWSRHPNVCIWLPTPPDLTGSCNPLRDLLSELTERSVPVEGRSLSKAKAIEVYQYPTLYAEVQGALDRVSQWIEAGTPAARIAVLLPSEGPYASVVSSVFQSSALSLNLSIPTPMISTGLGRWLGTWMRCLTELDKYPAFFAWCLHPFTQGWLKEKTGVWISQESLCSLFVGHASCDALREHIRENPDRRESKWIQALFEDLDLCASLSKRSLIGWKEFLVNRLGDFQIRVALRSDIDKSSGEVVETFLQQLGSMGALFEATYSLREFLSLLDDSLLPQQARSVGFPLEGVQILRLQESRLVPFDRVILLGCVEGLFPKALPADRLVPDWMKRLGGLSGWAYIEAMEDTTFQLLCRETPYLCLSYPEKCFQQPVVRSRFVEQWIGETKFFPIVQTEPDLPLEENIQAPFLIEKKGELSLSEREQYLSHFSSTTLDLFLTCPYRFLLHKLGVKKNWLFVDRDKQTEGLWLHRVFEGFYTGLVEGVALLEPFPTRIPEEKFQDYVCDRLWALSEHLSPISLSHTPLGEHLKLFSWPRFADHCRQFFVQEAGDLVSRFPLHQTEYTFGQEENPLSVSFGLEDQREFSVSLTGVMDHVERGASGYILTDYKRKKRMPAKEGSWWVPQLLLYAWVLDMQADEANSGKIEDGIVGYWSILEGAWDIRGMGHHAKSSAWGKRTAPDLQESVDKLTRAWHLRLRSLLAGKEDFAPTPSDACTFCDYRAMCKPDI